MTLNNLLLRPLNALAMLIWPLAITTPHLTAAEREYELITYSKPGALGTVFFDISNGGTIVGAWSPDGFIHQAGLIHRLGEDTSVEVPESSYLEIDAIGSGGDTVGDFWNADFSVNTAFIRSRDGSITDITAPPDTSCVCPFGVNQAGTIVGLHVNSARTTFRAYILEDGVYSFYEHPAANARLTQFNGINNSGLIVGRWRDQNGNSHPFTFEDGIFHDFEIPDATSAVASAVNDRRQIAGYYERGSNTYGFLYDDGEITTFDFDEQGATGIFGLNNSGQMVGATNFRMRSLSANSQGLIITPGRPVK